MDAAFANPIRIANGRTVVVLHTLADVGTYLIESWPWRQRGRKSYRAAVAATCRALAGRIEPEVARQVLLEALEDLAGKPSRNPAREAGQGR